MRWRLPTSLPFSLFLSYCIRLPFTFFGNRESFAHLGKYCFLFLGPSNPLGTSLDISHLDTPSLSTILEYFLTHIPFTLCTAPSFLFFFFPWTPFYVALRNVSELGSMKTVVCVKGWSPPLAGKKALKVAIQQDWLDWLSPTRSHRRLKALVLANTPWVIVPRGPVSKTSLLWGGRLSPHAEGTANNLGCFWNRK